MSVVLYHFADRRHSYSSINLHTQHTQPHTRTPTRTRSTNNAHDSAPNHSDLANNSNAQSSPILTMDRSGTSTSNGNGNGAGSNGTQNPSTPPPPQGDKQGSPSTGGTDGNTPNHGAMGKDGKTVKWW
ncbi:unnamed protein product [Zymoseptoria tritici ST99CH_1E4]|uniref:Uncharacterized protein n=1 Tax=Zymoseptoria tritici ST99CH_1E4 TaxID=1276532 RepID=A0A2H1GPQ3_ZYMTR|nr:unnamed protein product [Zymoseptoria tritici ST99CH_1E4]